ncbi:MAG: peroxiredoxin [uncultured archaeon A07HB70]|nr:MAG: peroxiredoxin [uncultured archaeon A07HB70]
MRGEGDTAPDFTLMGYDPEGVVSEYSLSETTSAGRYVILFFYPADFSPVCTPQLCSIRDAEFFAVADDVVAWGLSADTTYAHEAFARKHGFDFPLLADTGATVSSRYDAHYDVWEGQRNLPKRAVFLVDPQMEIRYVWRTDDAYERPDLWPLKEAVETSIEADEIDAPRATLETEPNFGLLRSEE